MSDGRRSGGGRTIGIDLGTSNSAVATIGEDGEPRVLRTSANSTSVPSVVSVDQRGGELFTMVGEAAQRAGAADPEHTLYGVKRLIGRRFDDPEVQFLAGGLPYRVVPAPNGDAWVQARGLALSPPQVSALVLRRAGRHGRGRPGRAGHRGGHHGAGPLRQRAAARHPRRGRDRRARRAPAA